MFLLRGSNQNPTRHCVAAGIPSRSTERFQRMGDLRGMPINFGMRKLQSWEEMSPIKHLQPTSKQFESWDENEHEKNHKAVKSKHEPTSKHCKTLFQRHPCVNVCHRNEMMLKRTMDNVKHETTESVHRRKFRSQTSDNMDRWKSRGGKSQRREEQKREDQRRERARRKKMQVREG